MITRAIRDEHGLARLGRGCEEIDKNLTGKALSHLLEYKASTSMDRKLLLGIFEPVKHNESTIPTQNAPDAHIFTSN